MIRRRIALFLAAVVLALPALAMTVAERSPFAQGHWWMPTRAGTGFDIFNAGGQVALIWYTYDEAGHPVWYNAQGDEKTLGTQSWPLWRQHWSGGHIDATTVVGSVKLTVRHSEGIDLDWEVKGQRGTWPLQPFVMSGVISEVDHTGHWYKPDNGGWGFTLTEQGDVLGSVLYTYDAAGEPTWIAGFERGIAPRIELFALTGACPSCAYAGGTSRSVGSVTLDMRSESSIVVHSGLGFPMAAGVGYDGASVAQLSRAASTRSADRRLAPFDSDAALKAYLDAGMMGVPAAPNASDFSAAPAGAAAAYSSTNLVEAGVDEADLVKTDGQRIYTFAYSNGTRIPAVRVMSVQNEGMGVAELRTVALASGASTPMGNAGLYLSGSVLVSVAGPQVVSYTATMPMPSAAWSQGHTYVEVLAPTTSDFGEVPPLSTRWRAEIDGYLLSSRRIGDRLYIVSRFVPALAGFIYGSPSPATVASDQSILAATPLAALLPQVRINGGSASPLVGSSEVYAPPQGSRAPIADFIVVTAIDLNAPRIAQALAIVGSAEALYASTTNLYVASARQVLRTAVGMPVPIEPNPFITDIHRIALGAQAMSVSASAAVEGYLDVSLDRAPFRMSEYRDQLRVVTSSRIMWGQAQNRLTILEPSTLAPGLLRTVSYLPNAQRPQPLGNPAEVLYATRFVDDRLYAVTFRNIDPLYIIDLADAADPKIAGSLAVPGFSEYLHPLPNGLLLGFGKDAVPSSSMGDGNFAWYQGLKLSLFDVRDATTLREMQSVAIGKRGSDSALLRDHHAFSMLSSSPGAAQLAIPVRVHDGGVLYGSGDATTYAWSASGLARFELRGTTAADAQIVQLPPLWTNSASVYPSVAPLIDAATGTGRSIIFGNGTVYVGNGQLWGLTNAGIPFGPY